MARPAVPRYTPVWLAALLGIAATLFAFARACSWEYALAEIDFAHKSDRYLEAINSDLGDADTLLYTIATFLSVSRHPMSGAEFRDFSSRLHRRVAGLRDTAFAPYVTREQRPAFERAARAEVSAKYEIRQFGALNGFVRAGQRPAYFPLLYIEAPDERRSLLGFDLISEHKRGATALRALRTGRGAATPPMDVVSVKHRNAGVLSYMPVYGGPGVRPDRISGIILGVFDIPVMVDSIVGHRGDSRELHLRLFAHGTPDAGPRAIYPPDAPGAGDPPSERAVLAGTHLLGTVGLADQRFDAIVTPAVPIPFVRWSWYELSTLIAGFAVTAMVVAYLLLSIRRTRDLETLTTDLRATTVTLHEKAEQIALISRRDSLTGIANRLMFGERLEATIARAGSEASFAVLFLDLDRFKAVNDTLGHIVGDRLLCMVTDRIGRCVRGADTAARLGGDEFAIILACITNIAMIESIANRLIDTLGEPYMIDGQPAVIGVSIGAAVGGARASASELIAQADLAMYAAKETGGGAFRIFEREYRLRANERRTLETDLRAALNAGQLEVHYQPLIDLASNRVSAFEALVRWRHPEQGMIPPDRFIHVAEECGLIGSLGAFVLRTACADAAGWPEPVKVAVNISPVQLRDLGLFDTIVASLIASGLPPERLEIEITEAAVMQPGQTTLELITRLRRIGITVALDDFGTGYSSLSCLTQIPFDKIKIDRSFLSQAESSPNAAAIVTAVVGLGSTLNVTTTGEGIETLAQLAYLRDCGCSEAQGYLFSPARPNADVPDLLCEINARLAASLDPVLSG